MKVFRSHGPTILKPNTKGLSNESWKELLRKTSQLRHTAVHRLRTTATGTKRLLESGRALLETLDDDTRAACIKDIETELTLTIDEMERNTSLLEVKMERQQIDLAEKRAELDRLEQQMIADMLSDDVESKLVLGSALETLLLQRTNHVPADRPSQETGLQEEAENQTPSDPDAEGTHADENADQVQATDPANVIRPDLASELYPVEEVNGSPGVKVNGGLASPDYFAELKSLDDEYHDADEGDMDAFGKIE